MWGHGGYNRLAQGKKDTKHRGSPVQAKVLIANEGVKFSHLACGAAHIVGLTVDNKVYTWGIMRFFTFSALLFESELMILRIYSFSSNLFLKLIVIFGSYIMNN